MHRRILKKIVTIYDRTIRKKNYLQKKLFLFLDKGIPYEDVIFINIKKPIKEFRKLAIFSHFDKDSLIDEYVFKYLQYLYDSKIDIVFISTAENLSEEELKKIYPFCRNIIVKKNIGYDFGSWKTGISLIEEDLKNYDSLVLCNDSVYLVSDIKYMFDNMKNKNCDFWAITDSYQHQYHLQSYFMVFNHKVFMDRHFLFFWKNIKSFKYKQNIINNYELGLTDYLEKLNYRFNVYCKSKENSKHNATHKYWKELIINHKCPIIKIELLRDNPTNIKINDWEVVLKEYTNFDIHIIKNHLLRIKNSFNK
jgi:lipopolysaccharide biosynthesis protein